MKGHCEARQGYCNGDERSVGISMSFSTRSSMKSMGSGLNRGSRPATMAKRVTPRAHTYVTRESGDNIGGIGVIWLVKTALGRVEVGRAGGAGHQSCLRAGEGVQWAGSVG